MVVFATDSRTTEVFKQRNLKDSFENDAVGETRVEIEGSSGKEVCQYRSTKQAKYVSRLLTIVLKNIRLSLSIC